MKKTIIVVLTIFGLAIFSGCAGDVDKVEVITHMDTSLTTTEEPSEGETPTVKKPTEEEMLGADFSEERVLVMMIAGIPLDKVYGIEDFPEVTCIEVLEVNAGVREIMQKQIKAEETGDWGELQDRINKNRLYDQEHIKNFKRQLCLILAESGRQNVIEAVRRLSEREDISWVGPDFRLYYPEIIISP